MAARRNATSSPTSSQAGILRPEDFARHARIDRVACDTALAPWVENHWCLRWDLPPGATFVSQTLPHPACTLSVELGHPRAGVGDERVVVTGVVTRRFDVTLAEQGWVLGVKFRPGGLAALTGADARSLTDQSVAAADVFPADVVTALRAIASGTASDVAAAAADAALLELAASRTARGGDPAYDTVLGLVAEMLADRSLTQVAELQERHHLSRRHVERLFARYVGVGPKWLLGRYRMHDVVEALDVGWSEPLADLAATYGWYDQAHFTRDFVRLVGVTPRAYQAADRS